MYLDDGWWVRYEWRNFMSYDEVDAALKIGEMNTEGFTSRLHTAETACMNEGREKLGLSTRDID